MTWRATLGDIWIAVADAGPFGGGGVRSDSDVVAAVGEAASILGRLIRSGHGGRAGQRQALGIAGWTLESCVSFAATRGRPRSRPQLLRSLEARLEEHEAAVRRGEGGYALRAVQARDLRDRIEAALNTSTIVANRSSAGQEARCLEECLIELAVLAVRAALNIAEFGAAAGPRAPGHRVWREHIMGLADETERARGRLLGEQRGCTRDGMLWRELLSIRAPKLAMAQVADASTDRTLRAEALVVTRSAWIRRAACQLAILSAPASEASAVPERRLRWTMVDIAMRQLVDAQLAARPGRFDHCSAWNVNDQLVLVALRMFLDTPLVGWDRREARTRPLLATGVSRAWLAMAVIDAQLGDRAIAVVG